MVSSSSVKLIVSLVALLLAAALVLVIGTVDANELNLSGEEEQQEESQLTDIDRDLGEDEASRVLPAPRGCKYNLRNFANVKLPSTPNFRGVELIRSPSQKLMVGRGPSRMVANKIPFNETCPDQPFRKRALTFFLDLPKNAKRFVAGCIGHVGEHQVEPGVFNIYDCNGTKVWCDHYNTPITLPNRTDLLIAMFPGSNRRPDSVMFKYTKREISSVYCDYFPF